MFRARYRGARGLISTFMAPLFLVPLLMVRPVLTRMKTDIGWDPPQDSSEPEMC